MKHTTLLNMVLCGLFAALTAVCSWISIPTTVPFTLQTLAVFCTLLVLGGQYGTISIIVYLLVGLAGAPVFAEFYSGLPAFMTPSGGYLIGFVFTGLIYWAITAAFGDKLISSIVGLVLGTVVCYAFGTVWFMIVYGRENGSVGLLTALSWCVFPFLIPDALKMALAIVVSRRVRIAGTNKKAA
ncbi:MAG: biotin transporter BioY [Oscillospiraceae bacterium]|nr:biotin transporter BioY [Oscillospiraceae bacterium]